MPIKSYPLSYFNGMKIGSVLVENILIFELNLFLSYFQIISCVQDYEGKKTDVQFCLNAIAENRLFDCIRNNNISVQKFQK